MDGSGGILGLVAMLAGCAPDVGPHTLAAIVAYESGGRRWAIGDNTTRHSYFPATRAEAEATARALLSSGHDLDMGLMQVNSSHLGVAGLSVENVFEPCTNVERGAAILKSAYARAVRRDGPGQSALMHALSAYNTGSLDAGARYANGVRDNAIATGLLSGNVGGATVLSASLGNAVVVHPHHAAPARSAAAVLGPVGDGEHPR